jgi:hypothetical protein
MAAGFALTAIVFGGVPNPTIKWAGLHIRFKKI